MTKLRDVLVAPIALIALIHIIGGVAIIAEPKAALISSLAGPYMLFHPAQVLGMLLIAVGGLALYGRLSSDSAQRFCFVLPQQVMLLLQLLGILGPLWSGTYPDGYMPIKGDWASSVWFILGDQMPIIGLCVSHLVEMMVGGDNWQLRELREKREEVVFLENQLATRDVGEKFQRLIDSMDLGPKRTSCDDCPIARRGE